MGFCRTLKDKGKNTGELGNGINSGTAAVCSMESLQEAALLSSLSSRDSTAPVSAETSDSGAS